MIKLYGYWRSTAAYRVRVALELKQLSYENILVDLVKDGGEQHTLPYQQLNPQQLVPTLVNGDFTINQSMAIIEYLDEIYPKPQLLFGNAELKSIIRSVSQQIACEIHPLNNLRVLQYLKNTLNNQQQLVDQWYSHWIKLGFQAIEKQLNKTAGIYCFGNEISLADVFLIPQVYNAHRFKVEMEDFHLINRINKACLSVEAFKKAQPENQPDAKK